VIALLLMGCLAEMTVAQPTSGSLVLTRSITPLAGFLVRYAYWTASCSRRDRSHGGPLYMHFWFPALPDWLWIVPSQRS